MTQRLVYFNSRDCLIRIDISNIIYFEGDGNYTYIVTANKMKSCLSINLSHTEEALVKQTLILSDALHFVYQLPVSKEALKSVKEIIVKARI